MRTPLAIGVIVCAALQSVAAQQPATTFRTGIDVLTLEAAVVDGESRPVPDLSVADFEVTIDGAPRRVVSARYIDATRTLPAVAESIIPSHLTNQGTTSGRIVLFVVDRDAIASGSERTVLTAATSMLDALGPADAAGAAALPQGSIELTRDKDRVRAALLRMTGTRPITMMQREEHRLSWDEALAFERREPRLIGEVVERECRNMPSDVVNHCPDELRSLSFQTLQTGRAQMQQTMAGLRALLNQLAQLRGTKHLVLLSGGLPFGQDLMQLYNQFAKDAAAAEVIVHAVHLDAFESDVANRTIVTSAFGSREFMTGLGTLASMTGGGFYQAAGSGLGIFSRITSAMSGFYQLGIETTPADRTGSSKPIEVGVVRRGLTVRYGRHALSPEPVMTGDRLAKVMQQPIEISELPIAVATYTVRGDEASTLRVLISAEFAQLRSAVEWGFTVFNEGNAIASGRQRIEPTGRTLSIGTQSAKLLPGSYRVRVGAIDAAGSTAVMEFPLSVGLRAAGDLQFSDLILGVAGADGKLEARSSIAQGETMSGIAEILSADPAVLEHTRAIFEIAQAGATEPLKRFVMAMRSGGSATLLSNQIEVSTTALPPGIYVATVMPMVGDQPAGRVSRRFEITATR